MAREFKSGSIPAGMHKVTKMGCVFGTGNFVNVLWEYGTTGAGSSSYSISQAQVMIDMWNHGWEVAYDEGTCDFWFMAKSA